jgi:hypothetical protein
MIPLECDTEWYKGFQMRYNAFISLCTILEPYIVRVDTNYSTQKKVYIHPLCLIKKMCVYAFIIAILCDA